MDQHFNWIFRFQPLISTYYKADQPTLWPIPLLFLQKLVYYDAQFRLFYGVNSSINVLLPSCNLVSVKTWKAVYNFYINYESIYSCLKDTKLGCRHSSVDSSVPTILLPWVQIPNKPSMLLFFIVKFVLYLSCEKNENKIFSYNIFANTKSTFGLLKNQVKILEAAFSVCWNMCQCFLHILSESVLNRIPRIYLLGTLTLVYHNMCLNFLVNESQICSSFLRQFMLN